MVLSFVLTVAFAICPLSSCVRKSAKVFGRSCGPGLISFWAKNASTTTMRIGNAALLKNLLMGRNTPPGRAADQQYQGGIGQPGGRLHPFSPSASVFPFGLTLQRGHERQVAIALVVV